MGLVLSSKKKCPVHPSEDMAGISMHVSNWKKKKKKSNGSVLQESISVTWWRRQSHGDHRQISGCQRLVGREGWMGRTQGTYRAARILDPGHQTVKMGTCHCSFFQTHRMLIKSKPYLKYARCMIMMCHYRFILTASVPLWWGRW